MSTWLTVRAPNVQRDFDSVLGSPESESRHRLPARGNRKTRGRELRPTTRAQCRMLLGEVRLPDLWRRVIDRISADDVNPW